MPKIKYTAVDANGRVHTRSSARTYTHMVAVRPSYGYALGRAKLVERVSRSNFDYYTEIVEGRGDARWCDVATATEKLLGATSFTDYVAKFIAKAVAKVEADKAAGHYDSFGSAGWCGRPDLADKLAAKERGEPWNAEVVILPAVAK
jgi:hypothetical protein